MNWHSIVFEPNLKFALELNEDLKTKYFEQHEKAKAKLESFSCSLKNIFNEHQKLLADNVELFVTNEKLKEIINENEHNQKKVSTIDKKSSENFTCSTKCNDENAPKVGNLNKKIDKKIDNRELIAQKENIGEFVQIFSCDFDSDIEQENFEKYKTPIKTILKTPSKAIRTPVKIQNSPILSKRKKLGSKRNNNLSLNSSSHSIASSNDSRISSINISDALEKNINEVDNLSDKECKKEFIKEPLKAVENNVSFIPNSQSESKNYKVLDVSKSNYSKSEFIKKGKRLRQSKLTLKKVVPIIDISKVESNESFNEKCTKVNNEWSKSYSSNDSLDPDKVSCKKTQNDDFNKVYVKKESSEVKSNSLNQSDDDCDKIHNITKNNDELIETSPLNSEKSKLRSKLNLNKKSGIRTIKVKSNLKHQQKIKIDNFSKSSIKSNASKYSMKAENEKQIPVEFQKTFSDDTYFSPAEINANNNMMSNYDMDVTEFEGEEINNIPPAKKMLLNSFDMIPGRKEKSPDYAYREGPVRNKNERAQLPGWCCRDCEKWYSHLPEDERKKRQNQCSRHRGKYKVDILTPESFWNPVFDDTKNSSVSSDS